MSDSEEQEIIQIDLPDLTANVPDLELPEITAEGLGIELPAIEGIQIPCGGGTLPTKAEIVNEFNKLSQIPSQLKAYLNEIKQDKDGLGLKVEEIEGKIDAKIKELEEIDVQQEIEDEVDSQIESEIAEIQEQIEDIIKQIEEVMDLISDVLSPYWKKGEVRDWQKEADDAITELISEFHIYIPAKMLEMISSVIPINFTVPILGISIDVLKILEKEEQERIIKQIEDDVDAFHAMLPAEYQQYKAEFGLKCDQYRARCTWQYIKAEIVKYCTNALHAAFGALIDKFKTIWDTLGLPSLPALLAFDVEAWLKGQIEAAKAQAQAYKDEAMGMVTQVEDQVNEIVSDIENFDPEAEIEKQKKKLEQQIKEFDIEAEANAMIMEYLEGLSLFGISLTDIIGGDIDTTVVNVEQKIDSLVQAARDWANQWEKELINMWIKKIKSFLDAIGLGKLLDLLTLEFCDVLPLIGIPTSFDVKLSV